MTTWILYTIAGYLSGSLLFARYFGQWLQKGDITADCPDHNPGTANAFKNGGFLCGILTLCCDLLKGFLPVYLYLRQGSTEGITFVLIAPVLGHILPVFHKFRGGKGIAVSFGCLLGLLPEVRPVLILAGCFIFFSVVFKITPHYHRTLLTYLFAGLGMWLCLPGNSIALGFAVIALSITVKLLCSPEQKESCKVELLWMH